MLKTFTIAAREYNAVVRSKAFVISIVLLPVMMVGSMAVARLGQKAQGERLRTFAVVDRTRGEMIYPRLVAELDRRSDLKTRFQLEHIAPPDDPAKLDQQNFILSERVRQGALAGILEIGRDVPDAIIPDKPSDLAADETVRYRTNTPAGLAFREWAARAINRIVQRQHLAGLDLTDEQMMQIQSQVAVVNKGLARKDAAGAVVYSEPDRDVASFLIPFGLVFLMFIVVIIGAVPMMQGIIEEKQNRIAEVLLGSVSPFQLMAGKVLGIVATTFTLILVYLSGGYFAAQRAGMIEYLPTHVLGWFMVFQLLSVLMYGSLYIAIGAACTDTKEVQSLLMPVNLVMAAPLMLMIPILMNPGSVLARLLTYFPPATPFVTVARLSVPPGLSVLELCISIAIVLGMTVSLVWASGRIFRVGILMQGKGANLGLLLKWVMRG